MKSTAISHAMLTLPLSGGVFHRFEKERKTAGFLAGRLTSAAAPSLVICRGDGGAGYNATVFVADEADAAHSWLLPLEAGSAKPIIDLSKAIYVGEDAVTHRNVFVTDPGNVEEAVLAKGTWLSTRALLELLAPQELAMFGLSLSMLNWVAAMRFCPRCGSALKLRDYGTSLNCTGACTTPHYPSVIPAMIVCVLDGKGNVLLSQRRLQAFPLKGKVMRTILAGFVSHGESQEDTVVREVLEETGANVSWLRYVGSQPWPYPYQLMGSYYALAEHSASLTAEEKELVSVGWVPKEEVRQALRGEHPAFCVPPPSAVAHTLLQAWVDGRVNDRGEEVAPLV